MIEDITCVFDGVGSVGAIYLSNLKAAQNVNLLNSLGIKAIVTAVRGGIVRHDKTDVSDHLYVPADDIESYDLSKHFEQTYNFIDIARKKTNVLVHCYAGISRSATIVIAYLIRKYGYSLQRVLTMVKRKRNKVNPNRGFVEQLKKEAERIGVVCNQNQQPIQQLLKKSFSSQKKRASSVKRMRNQKLSSQMINKIDLVSYPIEQIINSTNKIKQTPFQKLNLSSKRQQFTKNQSFIKLEKVQVSPDKHSIRAVHKLEQKTTKETDVEQQTQMPIPAFQKTTSYISEKAQKIEELKSKILQSHSRKKLAYSHRHSLSQRKNINKTETEKKEVIPRPSFDQNLSSMLSAKLNKVEFTYGGSYSKFYSTIKSTFSPDKNGTAKREAEILQ